MLQLHGMDQVVGSPLKTFVSAASWPALGDALKMAARDRVQGQMEIEPHSGRPRTIQLSLMPIRTARETNIMITATEVTELVEKNKALRATEDSLHSLSARILQLQDEERRRIARDLHDITGQELAVIIMSLNQLASKFGNQEVNAQEILSETVALVRKVEDEIRTLSYILHPPLLDEFGLRSALNWYAEGFSKRSGIKTNFQISEGFGRIGRDAELVLFRVLQECLTNVQRHSGSSVADVRICRSSDRVVLEVQDYGKGLPPELFEHGSEDWLGSVGVGMRGMRERLQQLAGSLDLRSDSSGTLVRATVPLQHL